MNVLRFFLPIFAIIALAITAPGWSHWIDQLSVFPDHVQFLLALVLPLLVVFLGASWLEPRSD